METTKSEANVRLGRLHRTSEGGQPAELETSAEAPSSFRLTPRIGLLALLGMLGLYAHVHLYMLEASYQMLVTRC